jgi:hypothetical protein
MAWVVSQLNERFDVSAFFVACAGQVRPSQPPQSRSGRAQRVLLNFKESNDLSLFPANDAWRHAGHPAEVSGQVALVGESR